MAGKPQTTATRRPRFLASVEMNPEPEPAPFSRPDPASRSDRTSERGAAVRMAFASSAAPEDASEESLGLLAEEEEAEPASPSAPRTPEASLVEEPSLLGLGPQPPSRESLDRIAMAIENMRLMAERLAEQARSDALEVAFQIARRILEMELSTSSEPLFALVRSAVRRAGESRSVAIRLSPADAAAIEGAGARALADVTVAQVKLVPDASLQRGDCVVEADFGTVDGRLGTRFGELRRAVAPAFGGSAT